jgi:uncharacterized phage protein (TIGR02218 family)
MPHTLTPEFQAHLESGTTRLAFCWKITRAVDGVAMGFTSFIRNITITDDALTYKASTGIVPMTARNSTGDGIDAATIMGILSSVDINKQDIFAGRYDYAKVEVFAVVYDDGPDLATGRRWILRGKLGEVQISENKYSAEIRGLGQQLAQTVTKTCGVSCKYKFQDAFCAAEGDFTFTAAVTAISEAGRVFTATALIGLTVPVVGAIPNDHFTLGKLKWTGGANIDLMTVCQDHVAASGQIALWRPTPLAMVVGDTFEVTAGCDLRRETCHEKFNNIINYGGEPDTPGADFLLTVPGTNQE